MARYIDADKLMEAIEIDIEPYKSWDCTKFDVVMDTISNTPTSDVAEVKHGEWIWTETGDEDYEQYWICSVCGEKDYIKSKYCPECGAKMSAK